MAEYAIKQYLMIILHMGLFLLIYNLVVVHGKKKTYLFFGVVELSLIALLIKAFYTDLETIVLIVAYQIVFLVFVKKYAENTERNIIFEILEKSRFTTVIFYGLKDLQDTEYQEIQKKLKQLIDFNFVFEKTPHLYISFADHTLIVRYIFKKRSDYELYVGKALFAIDKIENLEFDGEIVNFEYKCNIYD